VYTLYKCIQSNDSMTVSNKLETILQDVAVAKFEVLAQKAAQKDWEKQRRTSVRLDEFHVKICTRKFPITKQITNHTAANSRTTVLTDISVCEVVSK